MYLTIVTVVCHALTLYMHEISLDSSTITPTVWHSDNKPQCSAFSTSKNMFNFIFIIAGVPSDDYKCKAKADGYQPGFTSSLLPCVKDVPQNLVLYRSSLRAVFSYRRLWCQRLFSSNYSCLPCLARKATKESTRFCLLIICSPM